MAESALAVDQHIPDDSGGGNGLAELKDCLARFSCIR